MSLSRREFIALGLAGLGAVTACAIGGVGVTAWLLANRRQGGSATLKPRLAVTAAEGRQALLKQIQRPAIIPRADWGALPPDHEADNETGFFSQENIEGWRVYDPDIRSIYKTLVVHHSVVDEGDDLSTLLAIQQLHRQERGWADVAYHYFISKEGIVYEGRAVNVRGAHVAGYNTGSVGVCLLGNYMEDTPSEAMLLSLYSLGAWLAVRLQLTHVAGHGDFNAETVCPGGNVTPYIGELARQAGLRYGTDGYQGPTPIPPASPTPE
jgi:hypothetical protein